MVADAHHVVVSIGRLVIFGVCYIENGYVPIAPFLVSKTEVGLLLSAQAFAGCAALIPAGLAIDRLGPKPVLLWAAQVALLGLVLGALSATFPAQLLARLVLGAALAANFNASMALIMEHYQEPQRSAFLGSALGLGMLGNVVGPPLVGIIFDLAQTHGVPMPYFWALVHPILLLLMILWLLRFVPEQVVESEPLLKPDPESPSSPSQRGLVRKAFAVYLAAGAPAVMLATELVCTFGCASAFLTAGATELHREGFSSSVIGLASVPAAIGQSLASQLAGRCSGQAQQRATVLVGTPLVYATTVFLVVFLCSAAKLQWSETPPMIIVLMLVMGSVANGMVDAPSMSLMAQLASRQQLGYGQAVTSSEMAVTLGLAVGPMVATATVERNRQLALARRCERQTPTISPGELAQTAQAAQAEQIRRNREAALQRKRQREAAVKMEQDVPSGSLGVEKKDEDLRPQSVAVEDVCERKAVETPPVHGKDKDDEDNLPKSAEANHNEDSEDIAPMAEEGQVKPEEDEEEDQDDSDEEFSDLEDEFSSGSSQSSSYSVSSSDSESVSTGTSQGEVGEALQDVEELEVEEGEEEKEEKEEKEEEEEEAEPVDWTLRRLARPRREPSCCTQRWAPVELQALSSGETIAPKPRELRSAKQSLVAKLLCRWWYVLPDWPPPDFDYVAALAERGYRKVPVSDFETAEEMDGNLRKAFALPNGYKGLYRDEQGAVIDVRPVEGRPSYDQLMCRSNAELHKLLLLAYGRQLEVLESEGNGGEAEKALQQQLRTELSQAKNSLFKFGSKAG